MVRQFADPYAFLRELVQNSMDAGTTRIEVDVMRGADGDTRTRVTDSGSGMTPKIIENALLTLFSSSKEGDSTKIGKYGVGFVSVLAVNPEAVIVDTWRSAVDKSAQSESGAWRVTILRDHSYVLEEIPVRPLSGTSVTLTHTMDSSAFDQHVARVRGSLLRWCRHARVPIWLTVTDYANPQASSRKQLDIPLQVHTSVSVSDLEGEDSIVLGPGAGMEHLPLSDTQLDYENATPFVGFYNRGLTLFESSADEFAPLTGLRVKISSPKLKHTLSRDNVRREQALDELVQRAAELARRALPRAVSEALKAEATRVAEDGDASHYVALLGASAAEPTRLRASHTWFPLASPIDGQSAMTLDGITKLTPWRTSVLTVAEKEPISAAFARVGRPVVLCPHAEVVQRLALLGARGPEPVYERHLLIRERKAPTSHETALMEQVARCIRLAGVDVERVAVAEVTGAFSVKLVVARAPMDGVVPLDTALSAAARWGRGATLLLDLRQQSVLRACALARRHARTAAQLLARMIMLERFGPLTAKVNDALLRDHLEGAT
ncbi:MAG: ATP-binding protein [Myxococcales bacterium]|nr:ATP-binding protein [Myxococcales bacterium]